MKGARISYSAAEIAWIRAHSTWPRRKAHHAFCERFGRSDVSFDNFKALCTRKGWVTGRTGRFEKGITPANKGKRMPFNANSAKTRFRKGQLPHNTKFLGHERVSKNGYVEISIDEVNPHTGFERRYVLKHLHLWQQVNGPVPEGHCLKCMDGNKTNTDPSNWTAVPRALLPRLNGRWTGVGFDAAPPELKPAILATAKLHHAARERRKA